MEKENVFLHKLFNSLNSNQINYAVLRNYQQLPESTGGSDLDIWVKKTKYKQFLNIVCDTTQECGGILASYLPDKTCPRLVYQAPEWGIQLDVHIGIAQHKGVPYIDDLIIENHIIKYNGIKVLDSKIDGLISFLKEVLNNKKCREQYCTQAAELIKCLSQEEINSYLKSFSKPIRTTIVGILTKRDFNKETIKALGKSCSNDLQTFKSKIHYFITQIKKGIRFCKQPGYTIAVLGTDGSGKSFIINSITPILNEAFHNGIRYEHMRPNHLPSIAVLTGRKEKTETVTVCSNPHGSKPSGLIGSIIRLSYYWLDYTWGYFRKVFLDKALKTHVWLFDRYYYDYYIDQRRSRLNMPNWIIKMYGWFVPTPDLTICLGGDPKKIYTRKPETSLEEVARQTKILKDFARTHKKAIWVDTTVAPEESVKAVMEAIVKMMSKRFKL